MKKKALAIRDTLLIPCHKGNIPCKKGYTADPLSYCQKGNCKGAECKHLVIPCHKGNIPCKKGYTDDPLS